jgi:hypothetical protein
LSKQRRKVVSRFFVLEAISVGPVGTGGKEGMVIKTYLDFDYQDFIEVGVEEPEHSLGTNI